MKTLTTFVVTASQTLRLRLSDCESSLAHLLSGPFVLGIPGGGRTLDTVADLTVDAKLVFLAKLLADYEGSTTVEALVGEIRVDVGFFDQWWEVVEALEGLELAGDLLADTWEAVDGKLPELAGKRLRRFLPNPSR